MALLELHDVAAGYGGAPNILNGISITVEAGKSYCIIGPNGAGKSTLLKTICGILTPRTGQIVFDGEPLDKLRPDQILSRGLCFVPQDRSLFPDMSVRENLIMGGFLEPDKSVREQRMERVMEMFPALAARLPARAGTLSGGQQQMVAIGRSLMLEPKLLMIDEPSLGLAPRLADQIFDTIRSFPELGIAVLLIEQNAVKGLECSQWSFVLDLGTKRFEGPADEILADPRIRELYLGRGLSTTGEVMPGAPTEPTNQPGQVM